MRGAERIPPREIEEALLDHPAVTDAAAFPIPHRTLGDIVGAVVVLKPDAGAPAEEIRQFMAGRVSYIKRSRPPAPTGG